MGFYLSRLFYWVSMTGDGVTPMLHGETDQVCARFHQAIELIGKRWTGAVLRVLMSGPRRFTEILAAVPDLHDRLLSERLKELEAEGLVDRRGSPATPGRIEYVPHSERRGR